MNKKNNDNRPTLVKLQDFLYDVRNRFRRPATKRWSEITSPNIKRAARASDLISFRELTIGEDDDTVQELLCDLMHWAAVVGLDFDATLDRARSYFEVETLDYIP